MRQSKSIHTPRHGNEDSGEVRLAKRPPSSNRGVVTPAEAGLVGGSGDISPERLGRGMAGLDALTLVLPSAYAEFLVSSPGFGVVEEMSARYFGSAERWQIPGGHLVRKFEPLRKQKVYGGSYEVWEVKGPHSANLAAAAVPLVGYATRMDYAFDFSVSADTWPPDVVREIGNPKGLKRFHSGEPGKEGEYYGSRNSERVVRIYRKDEQDEDVAETYGPLMRLEVELKGKRAKQAWGHRRAGEPRLRELAAGHLRAMLQIDVIEDVRDVPSLPPADPERVGARKILQFVSQHRVTIQALATLGLDVSKLVEPTLAALSSGAVRAHRMRLRRRLDELQGVSIDSCLELLRGSSAAG